MVFVEVRVRGSARLTLWVYSEFDDNGFRPGRCVCVFTVECCCECLEGNRLAVKYIAIFGVHGCWLVHAWTSVKRSRRSA